MFKLAVLLFVFGCAAAQTYKVCISSLERNLCNTLDREGQAACLSVESRIDCAIKLARGDADFGVFNEEETMLLGQQQPNDNRVIATIRDVSRTEPFAFEAVAIVPSSHTNGLAGLSGYKYCHPGLDEPDQRWSPRVLKAFENAAAALNQCSSQLPDGMTIEEREVEELQAFFSNACRPGPWSYNSAIDADLKSRFPNLCSLCGGNNNCTGYSLNMGVSVAGVNNNNKHIQALECLRVNGEATVAYAAWTHVREFFNNRNPEIAGSYATLCPDGTTVVLTTELLQSPTAPCAFVRQPWPTIVANNANANAIQSNLRTWWPDGANPGGNTWQSVLFNGIVGGSNARVTFEEGLPSPLNYTSSIRPISSIDVTSLCQPARRWCTLSPAEHTKCTWIRTAAYSLGIQPTIACLQRENIFQCLNDIKEDRADFIISSSNYGYLARDHYGLTPVKLIQNNRLITRIAAFVRESAAQNSITRFENLRDKKACFPEFGGIAYVSFVRTAHERSVIAPSGCDYARVVGEFFSAACAPGAVDATHSLSDSDYNATNLCEVCRPNNVGNVTNGANAFTCSWDYNSNRYFGSNGSLSCLASNDGDIAFVRLGKVEDQLSAMGLQPSQFRALCRNNTLAGRSGLKIDDGCLLSMVVDAEVLTRRNDPLRNALRVLLETLDLFFGFTAENTGQHINLELYSPFDGVSDLLVRDSAIGFIEPSATGNNQVARNHVDLFKHLEDCNSAPGLASGLFSFGTMVLMALFARYVVY